MLLIRRVGKNNLSHHITWSGLVFNFHNKALLNSLQSVVVSIDFLLFFYVDSIVVQYCVGVGPLGGQLQDKTSFPVKVGGNYPNGKLNNVFSDQRAVIRSSPT